jgi:hypothetical protein
MPMRVGVYVDGFNLYDRGRDQFQDLEPAGRWKWIDLRALATSLAGWHGSVVDRVVYDTALRIRAGDPTSVTDQQVYLSALQAFGSVDHVEYGQYVSRIKNGVPVDTATKPRAVVPAPPPPGLPAREVRTADGTAGPVGEHRVLRGGGLGRQRRHPPAARCAHRTDRRGDRHLQRQ